ncbi:unnamed protein product [Sphagnum balticum]
MEIWSGIEHPPTGTVKELGKLTAIGACCDLNCVIVIDNEMEGIRNEAEGAQVRRYIHSSEGDNDDSVGLYGSEGDEGDSTVGVGDSEYRHGFRVEIGDGTGSRVDDSHHDFEEEGGGGVVERRYDDAKLGRALCSWEDDVYPIPIEGEIGGEIVGGSLNICECGSW